MITLLSRIFVKDTDDYVKIRQMYGTLCSVYGIILNIILFTGKYIIGIISTSIAIMADAVNNLSDACSSFVTLLGFKMAGKRADAEHPYGHGRVEYISAMVVSGLIILMGFELLRTSFEKTLHPVKIEYSLTVAIVLVISIFVKLYMFAYNRVIGKKIDSKSMLATALDSLSDAFATLAVLVTLLVSKKFNVNIDGIGGMIVAVFILYTGYSSLKDTVSPLLGKAPEPDFVKKITDITSSYKEILGIHDLMVHDYGPGRVFVSLHGEVDGSGNIFEIHDVIDEIENRLRDELGCDAVIHMDPMVVNDAHTDEMKDEAVKLVKTLDERFSIHDFRIIEQPSGNRLIFDVVTPFDCSLSDKEIREKISEIFKNKWGDYKVVLRIDKAL